MIYRMKIPNNDVEDKQSNYKQKVSFMPAGVLGCFYAVLRVQAN